MKNHNQTLTSEDLYNFLDNLNWKEIKKNPKVDQYPNKVLAYKGFEVFEHKDNMDKFLIKRGDFKRYINSYQNTCVDKRRGEILFIGWDDIIYFNLETQKYKTQHIR